MRANAAGRHAGNPGTGGTVPGLPAFLHAPGYTRRLAEGYRP